MKNKYYPSELKETFGSKFYRWITFNFTHTYTLKSNDGRKIFVDSVFGIIFDKNTFETIKLRTIKEHKRQKNATSNNKKRCTKNKKNFEEF